MKLKLYKKEIVNANQLSVAAGTNCPKGGDSGHGGRTYISIDGDLSTDMQIRLNPAENFSENLHLEILLGGDTECETIIEAFEFIIEALKGKFKDWNVEYFEI